MPPRAIEASGSGERKAGLFPVPDRDISISEEQVKAALDRLRAWPGERQRGEARMNGRYREGLTPAPDVVALVNTKIGRVINLCVWHSTPRVL